MALVSVYRIPLEYRRRVYIFSIHIYIEIPAAAAST